MSKPVKELIKKELSKRLTNVTSLAVVGFTGLDAVTTRNIRGKLRSKQISMTVVKNSIAKTAFKSLGLTGAEEMLDGPCALAYGSDSVVSVVRALLELSKDSPKLTVKAALLDGEVFGTERIAELSKYPTRPEAIGRAVSSVLSPGGVLAGCLIGPSGKIASILKSIEDKKKDEAAAQAAAAPATAAEVAPTAAAAPAAPAPAAEVAPAAPVAPATPAAPDTPATPETPKA